MARIGCAGYNYCSASFVEFFSDERPTTFTIIDLMLLMEVHPEWFEMKTR
jgi:hypothetical protein